MSKYIVLPRAKLEERIKELEERYEFKIKNFLPVKDNNTELNFLKELLKEGTDGKEIFEAGFQYGYDGTFKVEHPAQFMSGFEDFNNIKEE